MHTEPAATVAASDPDEVLPTLPPFPGIPTLDGHESELEAGCRGTIYYKTRPIPADQCGTRFFGELRAIQALMAVPGQRLVIEAPDGYALSVADAALTTGWMVTIARADVLEPTLAIADVGIPKDHGRVVANGIGPDRRVEVRMPLTEGTYIVELDAPLARDGWTFPGSLYFWVVDVG